MCILAKKSDNKSKFETILFEMWNFHLVSCDEQYTRIVQLKEDKRLAYTNPQTPKLIYILYKRFDI